MLELQGPFKKSIDIFNAPQNSGQHGNKRETEISCQFILVSNYNSQSQIPNFCFHHKKSYAHQFIVQEKNNPLKQIYSKYFEQMYTVGNAN